MPVRTPSLTLAPRPDPPRPQVAYGAPVKALKASAFAPKAVRRSGVVAMSANTDEIIEKMKTLTVRLPMGFRFPAIGPAPLPRDPRRARIPEEARGSTRENSSVILAGDPRSPPPNRPRRARRAASADAFSATTDVGEKPQPSNPEAILPLGGCLGRERRARRAPRPIPPTPRLARSILHGH